MERSEPSLVPEWLRNTGGSIAGGSSSHHLASSDGPSLALQKKDRTSKSISNSNGFNSSFLDRSSSTNYRRSSSSKGSSKNDKNSFARSYSSYARNQHNKDQERLDIADTWDSEYPDSLTSIIAGRIQKDTLRRSQSMISRRPSEFYQRKVFTDLRNNSHNINDNGNRAISISSGTTGIQKVSFEKDFPLLVSEEKSATSDMTRVPSLGLSRGVQGLSMGCSPLIGSEGWTSALAEVPVGSGSSRISSPTSPEHPPYVAAAAAIAPPASASASTCIAAGASNALNMAGEMGQAPVPSQNASQQSVQTQRFEELPFMGSKRLIPMTPSMPKTAVLNPSDKLKPKTAMRSNEAVSGPKNGLHQISSLLLGSQPIRGGPKSSSAGKLLLLKPAPSQTVNVPSVITNGQSTSVASVSLKNPNNVNLVDKKCSLAQLRSRNDFFNLVRKKSLSNTSAAAAGSVQNSDELKEMASGPLTPTENGNEVKCNYDADSFSYSRESDLSDDVVIYPNEEEEAFLRSLGWEDSAGDEDGLTEEEINAFVHKLKIMTQSDHTKWRPASKLCQGLQLKVFAQSDTQASCSADSSL